MPPAFVPAKGMRHIDRPAHVSASCPGSPALDLWAWEQISLVHEPTVMPQDTTEGTTGNRKLMTVPENGPNFLVPTSRELGDHSLQLRHQLQIGDRSVGFLDSPVAGLQPGFRDSQDGTDSAFAYAHARDHSSDVPDRVWRSFTASLRMSLSKTRSPTLILRHLISSSIRTFFPEVWNAGHSRPRTGSVLATLRLRRLSCHSFGQLQPRMCSH